MKIQINFDLLSKIKEVNTGLSLKRTTNKILMGSLFITSIAFPLQAIDSSPSTYNPLTTASLILASQIIYTIKSNKLFAEKYKEIASNELVNLLDLFKTLNNDINYESLLNSYTYYVEYEEFHNESIIPKIIQKKYFIIPIPEYNYEKEIELVQEHIIGSNIYDISYGSKEKKLKLATQSI